MEPLNRTGNAASTIYTPTTPGDWSPAPTQVGEALDQLAAKQEPPDTAPQVGYSPATPANWPTPPTQVAQALDELATTPYTPATPSNWSPVPTKIGPALDQLAARPSGGGGGGVELLFTGAVPPVSITLSLTKTVSILVNNSGALYNGYVLPDGTDGQVKEIVNGINGYTTNPASAGGFTHSSPLTFSSTNSLGNDAMDLVTSGASVRLVWLTAAGGWVATSFVTNAAAGWD